MKYLIEYLRTSKGNMTGRGPRNEVWSEVSEAIHQQQENERLRTENEQLREVIRCTALGVADPHIESLWKSVNGYSHQAAEAGEEG